MLVKMSHEQRVALMMGLSLMAFWGLGQYVYRHVHAAFDLKPRTRQLYALLLALSVVCAVLPRFFADVVGRFGPLLGTFASMVVLGILLSGVLLLPYDLSRGLAKLLPGGRTASAGSAPTRGSQDMSAAPSDTSRRSFLQRAAVGGAVGLGVSATGYGTLLGRHDFTLESVPIRLAKLPRTLDGFRIVQLSDLHVGAFVGDYEFKRGLELVRRARPDLVVLTGDLIDYDIRYVEQLGRFVRALSGEASHGLYAVMGNHDHYTGVRSVASAITRAGGRVLDNRSVRVGEAQHSFMLGGLDDVVGASIGRGPDPVRTFADAPDELARVLLSHNPGYFPKSRNYADLTLSGHTHGGQITLFINPAEIVLGHGLVRGHYQIGDSQLYVNRGFGTAGPPTRIGSPPEVTQLILTV